jgi:ATP-dependent protease HslVU (ClpYQ) peptidase subunit
MMTTVAANLSMMVCDSQVSDGDQKWEESKVHEHKGTLYGLAGDAVDGAKFMDWVRSGRKGRKPKLDDEFAALSLNKRGLFWYDNKLYPRREKAPYSIGTGSGPVRAALAAFSEVGMDPDMALVRAVEIACDIDAGSMRPVRVHRLKQISKK